MAAITAAAIGVAGTIYATSQAKKQQKQAIQSQQDMMKNADPYAAYRGQAAQQLNTLMSNPATITDLPTYKARLEAAGRAAAANGFTGSGNALVAAADAGGSAYQQEFENLAMLSGASTGLANKVAAYSAGQGNIAGANDSYLSGISGTVNNLTNLTKTIGNFNKPVAQAA